MPHIPGPNNIKEYARMLYTTSNDSFREAIANALDTENCKKIVITLAPKLITIEDWGTGINNLTSFRTYAGSDKPGNDPNNEVIGNKGLGKLSLLRLSDEIFFKSSTGKKLVAVVMDLDKFKTDMSVADDKTFIGYMDHAGTKIEIHNPFPDEIPKVNELASYLRKTFGLRLARDKDLEIILNEARLAMPLNLDATEHYLFTLPGGIKVHGNIKADDRGNGQVDLYVKHIFVENIGVDMRRFKGWVNYNGLELNTARDQVQKNKIFKDFFEHLQQYIGQRGFARISTDDEGSERNHKLLEAELTKMASSSLKNLHKILTGIKSITDEILITGTNNEQLLEKEKRIKTQGGLGDPTVPGVILGDPGQHTREIGKQGEREVGTQGTLPILAAVGGDNGNGNGKDQKKDNINKKDPKANEVVWYFGHFGADKPPIFFVLPNRFLVNKDNPITLFALKDKTYVGPKWMRIMPFLARAVLQVDPRTEHMNIEDRDKAIDNIITHWLRERGEI